MQQPQRPMEYERPQVCVIVPDARDILTSSNDGEWDVNSLISNYKILS